MDSGLKTLNWLFNEQLNIDKEWSIQTNNGFKWWADKHAQTIEVVGKEFNQGGMEGDFISIRTDLLKGVILTDRNLEIINSVLMPFSSMSGPVYDDKIKTLSLCTLVRVHNEISQWMNPLISVAAMLQVGEARILGSELAMLFKAEEAISGHPEHGMRSEPDELANLISSLIAPMGAAPSKWEEWEFHDIENFLDQSLALSGKSSLHEFTAEFPYSDRESYCQITNNDPHPRYGNGLLVLQSFPVSDMTQNEGVRLALLMNDIELKQEPLGYGFGSYVYSDGLLRFTSFFPNAIYRQGMLPNIFFSCDARAEEVSLRLSNGNWKSLLSLKG